MKESSRTTPRVLICCSDRELRRAMWLRLQREGFRVSTAADEFEALEQIERGYPDILILSPQLLFPVRGVDAVLRQLEDSERLVENVHWAARELLQQRRGSTQ